MHDFGWKQHSPDASARNLVNVAWSKKLLARTHETMAMSRNEPERTPVDVVLAEEMQIEDGEIQELDPEEGRAIFENVSYRPSKKRRLENGSAPKEFVPRWANSTKKIEK